MDGRVGDLTFSADSNFAFKMDIKLKPFWESKSYEGRFIIAGSEFLQKTHGIDVILQAPGDKTEYKIDTKHRRKHYNDFFLEEYTNSTSDPKKPGWILKEGDHPDYIFYCFWTDADYPVTIYVMDFSSLQKWFTENREKYPVKITKQINRTIGRIVSIADLRKAISVKKFHLPTPQNSTVDKTTKPL